MDNQTFTNRKKVVQKMRDHAGSDRTAQQQKRLGQASCFSIMADECTDDSTIEELSIHRSWEEDGVAEEHF